MAASCLPAILTLAASIDEVSLEEGGEVITEALQLDSEALPTAAHLAAMADDLAAAQSAVLLEILLAVISCAAAGSLGQVCSLDLDLDLDLDLNP